MTHDRRSTTGRNNREEVHWQETSSERGGARASSAPIVGVNAVCHFAMTHAPEVRAVVERGDAALRSELENWGPHERATFVRVLAEVT